MKIKNFIIILCLGLFFVSCKSSYETTMKEGTITNIVVTPEIYNGKSANTTYETNSDGVATIYYKSAGTDDSNYTTTAPSSAGNYTVLINISEGKTTYACQATKDFTIAKATPTYESLEEFGIKSGDKLEAIILPDGFEWEDGNQTVTAGGTYTARYVPSDSDNYNTIPNISVTVGMVLDYVKIPKLKDYTPLIYSGSEQGIDISTQLDYDSSLSAYVPSKTILTATNAGEYSIVMKLNDTSNYAWIGGSKSEMYLEWSINKAQSQEYSGSISLSGTYNPAKTLSSYSLSDYLGVYWKNSLTIPTVPVTKYPAYYYQNDDKNNYYASDLEITLQLSKANPTYTTPTNLNGKNGNTLSTVTLPSGWSWVDGTTVISADITSYPAVYTPSDTDNYNVINTNITINVVDYDFNISCESGTNNSWEIIEKSNGEKTIKFGKITQDSVYAITGQVDGNIVFDVGDDYKVELEMKGVNITSSSASPIVALSADKVSLVAKSGYSNYCNDTRASTITTDDASSYSYDSACYSEVDLTLKGNGSFTVTSLKNGGIHTKDDLECKNLTLQVMSYDNALKGNDSVEISSGTYQIISTTGNGIRTSNSAIKYNADGSVKKIQGTISIDSAEVNIYSALDALDASYDCIIGETTASTINIYTSNYSQYSSSKISISQNTLYIKSNTTSYKYSIYFYNSSSDFLWANSSSYQTADGYYYYPVSKPDGYSNLKVYVYTQSQTQGNSSAYYAVSESKTLTSNYDTIDVNSNYSWTLYSFANSSQNVNVNNVFGGPGGGGNGPGGGPGGGSFPGGQSSGNSNKSGNSAKGIKAQNDIYIYKGNIYLKTYDDAIHASRGSLYDDEDNVRATGNGNVYIKGGEIIVYSSDDGIHADMELYIDGGLVRIDNSYEGIEGYKIYVTGGETYIYSTDDAINAAQCGSSTNSGMFFQMSGGYVDADVSSGDTDTLDSNGNVTITGGVLILKNRQSSATSNTGGTLDLDGTLTINSNAVVVSVGTWSSERSNVMSNSSNAFSTSVSLTSGSYSVKSGSNVLCEFDLPNKYVSYSGSYRGYRIYCPSYSSYKLYKGSTQI